MKSLITVVTELYENIALFNFASTICQPSLPFSFKLIALMK